MQKGTFDFDDFLLQAQSVKKLGGMGGMLKMRPGIYIYILFFNINIYSRLYIYIMYNTYI